MAEVLHVQSNPDDPDRFSRSNFGALTLDIALYEEMLAESDVPEPEKRAFLETLWEIVVAFVDLGYGVHPLQMLPASNLGSDSDTGELASSIRNVLHSSPDQPTTQFAKSVGRDERDPAAMRES